MTAFRMAIWLSLALSLSLSLPTALALTLVAPPLAGASSAAPGAPDPFVPSVPRFEALADPAPSWLPASIFSSQDLAAAGAAPPLRVAVPRAGVPAHVNVQPGGEVQGSQVQWLLSVAQVLGLNVTPVVFADEAAALQALRDGRADIVLAAAAPTAGPPPGLVYSLGAGAQPLAWLALREQRLVPLDSARIAHGGNTDAAAADRLRRHYPGATLLPASTAAQALQAVLDRRADACVGSLLPLLGVMRQTALPGLELRQVWPGSAGHRHLVLRDEQAALLPALNKAMTAWRATAMPHKAVLHAAQQAGAQLRAPLAMPADVAGADTAVMDRLLRAPYALSADATERQPLAYHSLWRVGVVKTDPTQLAAALSGLDAQGRHVGSAADTVQELVQRLGLVLTLKPFDTEAAMLEALRGGRIDAVPLLEYSPERARGLQFSLPWLELPQLLVGADTGPLYWGLETLRGRRLALAVTHPLRGEVQRLHPGIQVVDAADGAAALALVQQGAADVAMDIKPLVQQQLAGAAGNGLRVLGDVAAFAARYRVAVADDQRRLLPVLDAALADIDAAERQRSLQRWLVHEPLPSRTWWQNPLLPAALAVLVALLAGLLAWCGWRLSRRSRATTLPAVAGPASSVLDGAAPLDIDIGLLAQTDLEQEARDAPDSAARHSGFSPSIGSPVIPTPMPVHAAAADGPCDFQLEPLLESVVLPHHRLAESRGQRLMWSLDEALPTRMHSDPVRLSQLLDLLLSRALDQVAPQGAQGRVAFKAGSATPDNGLPELQLAVSVTVPLASDAETADPLLVKARALAATLGGQLMVRGREGVAHAVSVRVPMRGTASSRESLVGP